MAAIGAGAVAKFAQLPSCVDVSFWSELGERKLNKYKLSAEPVDLTGWFGPSRYTQLPGQLQLDSSSFPEDVDHQGQTHAQQGSSSSNTALPVHRQQIKPGMHVVPGTITNFNTIDAFKAVDKPSLLRQVAAQVWRDVRSGAAEQDPTLLARFSLITFADLKAFKFTYWFLFPVLKPPTPFTCHSAAALDTALGPEAAAQVCSACDAWRGLSQPPSTTSTCCAPTPPAHAWLLVRAGNGSEHIIKGLPLSQWADVQGGMTDVTDWTLDVPEASKVSKVLLAVSDVSNLEGHAGWTLRNVLLLMAVRWGVRKVQVVCCRDLRGRTDPTRTQLLTMGLPAVPADWNQDETSVPDAVGWEPGPDGRLDARHVDLSAHMSPHSLAEQAVDLNLHLMKWRAVPELDTQRVANTKCLLLGAGTLGCAVARTLLAWGVRHITFVDSSKVAFSNPVRQWLYDFEDSVGAGGGKPKAQAAADALRRIFPSVQSHAHALTIPMPGHPPRSPSEQEEFKQAAEELDALVQGHDVVFLLTDTRESRWLPSLLAAAHGKLAITSAVGFDSFLVMRHGAGPDQPLSHPSCPRLGCYFCNDVVAPLNSTRDRTLDQQCTVARPGLAPVASALSVELMVTLIQHPLGTSAPAPSSDRIQGGPKTEGVLGVVPHMVRGQLSGFQQTLMEGAAFSQCTACSAKVVEQYRQDGWEFLLKALQDPKSLEDLTGLTQLHQDAMDLLCDDDEDEEVEEELEGEKGKQEDKEAGQGDEAGGRGGAGAKGKEVGSGPASDEGDDWTTL